MYLWPTAWHSVTSNAVNSPIHIALHLTWIPITIWRQYYTLLDETNKFTGPHSVVSLPSIQHSSYFCVVRFFVEYIKNRIEAKSTHQQTMRTASADVPHSADTRCDCDDVFYIVYRRPTNYAVHTDEFDHIFASIRFYFSLFFLLYWLLSILLVCVHQWPLFRFFIMQLS